MKLGMIGDAHLGCADYTDKRRADFAAAFANAVNACLEGSAEAICLLGDVFDSALMRRNVEAFASAMRDVAPLFVELRRRGVPLLAIAGNHEFGRGREAAELSILENLGFLRVLRGEELVLGGCSIMGFPWHSVDELHSLPLKITELARTSSTRQRILLLHNFIRGSGSIPSHLGEVDQSVATGFDRVFVGHHHDAEEVGLFVMPGSTEVQNLAEAQSHKAVVIYDTSSNSVQFQKLARTRDVIVLDRDIAKFEDRDQLLGSLVKSLEAYNVAGAFVCVRITGQMSPRCSVTKSEIIGLLRSLDVFDRYVEVRTTRPTKKASDAVRGVSVDDLVKGEFGAQANKAQKYLAKCTDEGFPAALVDEVLK